MPEHVKTKYIFIIINHNIRVADKKLHAQVDGVTQKQIRLNQEV